MKEIIYLDTRTSNSVLAQLEQGLTLTIQEGLSSAKSESESNSSTSGFDFSGKGGVPTIGSLEGTMSKDTSNQLENVYTVENQDLIETALDDFSIDVLIEKLEERNALKNSEEGAKDGDFILVEGKFNYINFDEIKKHSSQEFLSNFRKNPKRISLERELDELNAKLKRTKKSNKAGADIARIKEIKRELNKSNSNWDNYIYLNALGEIASVIFKDTSLIKVNNSLSFCNNDLFRTLPITLSLMSQSNRKVKILGIKISEKTEEFEIRDGQQLPVDLILSQSIHLFSDVILSNFNLAEKGDSYIRPISIFYE